MWLGLEGWRSKQAPGQGKHRPGFLTCWARKAGPIRAQLSGTHMQLGRWRSHFQWPLLTQHGQPDPPVRGWGLEDAVELQISHSVLFCSVFGLLPKGPSAACRGWEPAHTGLAQLCQLCRLWMGDLGHTR